MTKEEKLNRIIELLEKAPLRAEEESKAHGEDGKPNYPFAFGYLESIVHIYAQELRDILQGEAGTQDSSFELLYKIGQVGKGGKR